MFTRELLKNMPDDFVKSKIAVFFWVKKWNSMVVFFPGWQNWMHGRWTDWERIGLLVVNGEDCDRCKIILITIFQSWSVWSQSPRLSSWLSIKASYWSYMDWPYVPETICCPLFFKLIALQDSDFICKSRNQLLDLDLFNFCETIISFTIQSWTQMKILSRT